MGIANCNADGRKIFMHYTGDWETIVNRMGSSIGVKQFPIIFSFLHLVLSIIVLILFCIRFREQLRNSSIMVHGIYLLGFQTTLRQRARLPWIQSYAFSRPLVVYSIWRGIGNSFLFTSIIVSFFLNFILH